MDVASVTTTIQAWTSDLAIGIEAAAAVVIGLAAIEATLRALWIFAHPSSPPESKELLRLRLGRWLSLGLEFELAADIVRTAVAPGWGDIGKLAAIVVIRTVLNFFLERDIQKAASVQHAAHAAEQASG